MMHVTISHCRHRRGYADASPFIDDIPEEHRKLGWLRAKTESGMPQTRDHYLADALSEMEPLKRL
jgi:hypothetical protein